MMPRNLLSTATHQSWVRTWSSSDKITPQFLADTVHVEILSVAFCFSYCCCFFSIHELVWNELLKIHSGIRTTTLKVIWFVRVIYNLFDK